MGRIEGSSARAARKRDSESRGRRPAPCERARAWSSPLTTRGLSPGSGRRGARGARRASPFRARPNAAGRETGAGREGRPEQDVGPGRCRSPALVVAVRRSRRHGCPGASRPSDVRRSRAEARVRPTVAGRPIPPGREHRCAERRRVEGGRPAGAGPPVAPGRRPAEAYRHAGAHRSRSSIATAAGTCPGRRAGSARGGCADRARSRR